MPRWNTYKIFLKPRHWKFLNTTMPKREKKLSKQQLSSTDFILNVFASLVMISTNDTDTENNLIDSFIQFCSKNRNLQM